MIPVLSASDFLGPGPVPAAARRGLESALSGAGAAHLILPRAMGEGLRSALAAARAFFDLPVAEKEAISIQHSPHHRGWSVMHNERDWREQVHLGWESAAVGAEAPGWHSLEGPNQWPASLGEGFRSAIEAHLMACAALGQGLARALADSLGLDLEWKDPQRAYLLLKLIAYHAQEPGTRLRRGVAAHVDFSLLTLLAQDGSGGLEIRNPQGHWVDVPPMEDALFLNAGEILEALCGGSIRATPHRVTHGSSARSRISMPVFFNPPLEAWIEPGSALPSETLDGAHEHVHRVLTGQEGRFQFGAAEWRRKALNHWCASCCG